MIGGVWDLCLSVLWIVVIGVAMNDDLGGDDEEEEEEEEE